MKMTTMTGQVSGSEGKGRDGLGGGYLLKSIACMHGLAMVGSNQGDSIFGRREGLSNTGVQGTQHTLFGPCVLFTSIQLYKTFYALDDVA